MITVGQINNDIAEKAKNTRLIAYTALYFVAWVLKCTLHAEACILFLNFEQKSVLCSYQPVLIKSICGTWCVLMAKSTAEYEI